MQVRQQQPHSHEKQRLRDTIGRQVDEFLASGGNITVYETPALKRFRFKGSVGSKETLIDEFLD